MPPDVDPSVESFYNVTSILCGLVFCDQCKREASYASNHPPYSDQTYYEQAAAMMKEGWRGLEVLCPSCARAVGR